MKDNPDPNNNQPAEPPADVALREQIEKRAYHLWLTSGSPHGEHLQHWLQAESEVLKAIQQDQEERASARKTKPPGKHLRSATVFK
jgi:hypothetical protein